MHFVNIDDHKFFETDYTVDRLLDGKVTILQPKSGYRVAVDPILLAAAVDARPGQKILDVGFGVGTASICLHYRVPGIDITGIEINQGLIELAEYNCQDYSSIHRVHSDIKDVVLPNNYFNQVITNPPYFDLGKCRPSPNPLKAQAHIYSTVNLQQWIKFCINKLQPRGVLTLIYRADCFQEIIASFEQKVGGVIVYPIWPRENQPATRLIIRATKGSKAPTKMLPGLILHDHPKYTAAAERLLKRGEALDLSGV